MPANDDLLYQIALTLVPNIGAVHAKTLVDMYGSAAAVFREKKSVLEHIEGIGSIRASNIKQFRNFKRAEEEISFISKYKIRALFLTDPEYPKRFLHCYDPPTVFYYHGNADLNSPRMLAIVGTRMNTDYGKIFTSQLIRDIAGNGLVIVSGLAYGIDAIAHKTALKYDVPTVGVVGHGLDSIYPPQHNSLAKEMIRNGGMLTEFRSGTKADKLHFPIRNRIVAGICDAVVVVETGIKGGSMITAEVANGYNRDVFAVPGRTSDSRSQGCNLLIRNNKAILLSDGAQLLETLGWENLKKKPASHQRAMFHELSADEKILMDFFLVKEIITIDELNLGTSLSSSAIAAAMLNLEFQGLLASLPGKRYKLI